MAIDDNTLYGLTGSQVKELVEKVKESDAAFKPFPASVVTDGTTEQFMNSILALNSPVGTAYLGTVSLSDLPAGLVQEEVAAYVYSDYVVYCDVKSTDVAPYEWWCASYNYGGWRPVNTTYSAGTGLELNGTTFSVDDTIATKSEIPTTFQTIFYMNSSETGGTRHIYKKSDMTDPATSKDVFDANEKGQVILRISTSITPDMYSDAYLQNAYSATGDYQLLFLDEKTYRSFDTTNLTDSTFVYSSRVIQDKLTAGTNVQINGAVISATDTTYSAFTGTDGQTAGAAGLVPAPATTDAGKVLGANGTWVDDGPTVVQSTGTSTADVMSQDATSNMLWRDPSTKTTIQYNTWKQSGNHGTDLSNIYLGYDIIAREGSSANNIVIGHSTSASGQSGDAVLVGNYLRASEDDVVAIGNQDNNPSLSKASGTVSVGAKIGDVPACSVVIGSKSTAYQVSAPSSTALDTVVIGGDASTTARGSVAIGRFASASSVGEFNIGLPNASTYEQSTKGYSGSAYRLLTGVYDGQSAHDAATKGQLDSIAIKGAGAPTTATVGTVGQLYEDTTNGELYQCTAIVPGTDPDPDTYTWSEVAKTGDIPTTTSQLTNNGSDGTHQYLDTTFPFNADSNKQSVVGGYNALGLSRSGVVVLGDAANSANNDSVAIGARARTYGTGSISIASSYSGQGEMSVAFANYGIAIGYASRAGYGTDYTKSKESVALGHEANAGSNIDAPYSVALGAYSQATQKGQVDISTWQHSGASSTYGYNNSPYRLLTGLYDPQSAHDAATKGYVDTAVSSAVGLTIDDVYPVGSYYETSDTTFNPNTKWPGTTWSEDTAGRVLIAVDTGTFNTVGATGGSEKHQHDVGIQFANYYGAIGSENANDGMLTYDSGGVSGVGSKTSAGTGTRDFNSSVAGSMASQSSGDSRWEGSTSLASGLPPYTVVKRWHRTA